jgi:gas vesicle protein
MKTQWMFCAGLAGFATGVFLALAFAPQSGKETQDLVKQKARQGLDRLTTGGKKMGTQLAAQGRDLAARGKEEISDALETGRQVYDNVAARVG